MNVIKMTPKRERGELQNSLHRLAIMAMAALALPCAIRATPPSVSDIQFAQNDERLVTISYTLSGADAIVMMDLQTNGVSIGKALYANATGDVNVKVKQGARKIIWQPRETWPDQKIRDRSLSVKLTVWPLDNPPDYMCVDLVTPSNVVWYVSSNDVPGGVTADIYKTDKLLMRRIHAEGIRWRMGSPTGEGGYTANQDLLHEVILTNDFYIGVYQVTARQYARIMGTSPDVSNPTVAKTHTYWTAIRGARPTYDWPAKGRDVDPDLALGKMRKLSGIDTFDLPTEAEWEFACRAGTTDSMQGASSLADVAWYNGSDFSSHGGSGVKDTQKVGLLRPNGFGLYDMLGNGTEACNDWHSTGDDYCKTGELKIAPIGPNAGSNRVGRGMSVDHGAAYHRSCYRPSAGESWNSKYMTFRLYCSAIMD